MIENVLTEDILEITNSTDFIVKKLERMTNIQEITNVELYLQYYQRKLIKKLLEEFKTDVKYDILIEKLSKIMAPKKIFERRVQGFILYLKSFKDIKSPLGLYPTSLNQREIKKFILDFPDLIYGLTGITSHHEFYDAESISNHIYSLCEESIRKEKLWFDIDETMLKLVDAFSEYFDD